MMDYGNARIAALRARLLDPAALRRLAELGSAAAVLATLERSEDWRGALREAAPLFGDAPAAIEAAVERHRSARLAELVGWYDGPSRRLVEALVLGLDLERVVAIVRRRRAGASADAIGATIVRGALLGPAELGEIARAGDVTGLVRVLVRSGVVTAATAASADVHVVGNAPGAVAGGRRDDTLVIEDRGRRVEDRLVRTFDAARLERASGSDPAARFVQARLLEEFADRDAIAHELVDAGAAAAWHAERSASLGRLDRLAHEGPRDPLGIGAVAGYVAAVNAEAIRIRAALARVVAGWGPETMAPFLVPTGV